MELTQAERSGRFTATLATVHSSLACLETASGMGVPDEAIGSRFALPPRELIDYIAAVLPSLKHQISFGVSLFDVGYPGPITFILSCHRAELSNNVQFRQKVFGENKTPHESIDSSVRVEAVAALRQFVENPNSLESTCCGCGKHCDESEKWNVEDGCCTLVIPVHCVSCFDAYALQNRICKSQ